MLITVYNVLWSKMKPEDKQSNLANVFFTTELVIFQHAWIEISPGARLGYRVWGLSPGHGERGSARL